MISGPCSYQEHGFNALEARNLFENMMQMVDHFPRAQNQSLVLNFKRFTEALKNFLLLYL